MLLPKTSPSLPEPAHLDDGFFVDCHRASYGHFPESVADEDLPVAQSARAEWVQARR